MARSVNFLNSFNESASFKEQSTSKFLYGLSKAIGKLSGSVKKVYELFWKFSFARAEKNTKCLKPKRPNLKQEVSWPAKLKIPIGALRSFGS